MHEYSVLRYYECYCRVFTFEHERHWTSFERLRQSLDRLT